MADLGTGARSLEAPVVTAADGLSPAAVQERVALGLVNQSNERTSRTFGEIVRANVFTRFNAILGTALVAILATGHLRDALFGIVLVANALVGIVQEWRAKRTLDRLAVLSAPRARVVRDGEVTELAVGAIVLDDLVELRTGDQVVADGVVRTGEGLEVDESLLTGESDPVDKGPGDEVLSGSFVVAGSGRFQATRVGDDAYARRLAAEARRFTLVHSEIVAGVNQFLRYITWGIVVAGPLLLVSQTRAVNGWQEIVQGTVAGCVAMVPEGLVLLTSIAFGVAAVTLARRQVLVQELPAVEGLARVDVVCLDKTGTITDGDIVFDELDVLADGRADEAAAALGALGADESRNATTNAIAAAFDPPASWTRTAAVAFSSARKWSAATFAEHGTWVLGAPEMIWSAPADDVRVRADELAASGKRVLLLARSDRALDGEALPVDLEAVALVLFEERVRPDAAETLRYFEEQGVALKVISGDNPRTVGAVAARVGLPGADRPVDARDLPEDLDQLADVLEGATVFGRVSPHQKRAMVGALQARGHVVAMTGDGVNDALALKDADIGVAMGSGAAATRAVAQLVLLDGRFATLPGVVAEGRRVTANIERVAVLFLNKSVYAVLLALAVGISGWEYPYLPRHLTLISSLTIGIPAFFLALAPNTRRYVPGFVERVLRFAVPAGVVSASAVVLAYGLARAQNVPGDEARTTATVVLFIVGWVVLAMLASPYVWWRVVLVVAMAVAFVLAFVLDPVADFFDLVLPPWDVLSEALVFAGGAVVLLVVGRRVAERFSRGRAPTGTRAA